MKFWGTLFFLVLSLQLAAQTPPRVLATTSFLADITQQLAGNDFVVESLLPVGSDPHTYEPVPGDAQKIAEADLILMNGLNLEGWLEKLIQNSGSNAPVVVLTTGIVPIGSADHANSYDPHAWMNPAYGRIYLRNALEALLSLAPERADSLQSRYDRYDQQLAALDKRIEQMLAAVPQKQRIIATSHDAFRYFGNRYNFSVISVLGTTTDAEVRLEDLQQLIATIAAQDLPAIFVESTINPKLMQQVAGDAGIRIGGKLFADSMGPKGSGADSYLGMLEHNARVLYEGLTATGPAALQRRELGLLGIIAAFLAAAFVWVARGIQKTSKASLVPGYMLEVQGLTVAYDNKVILNNFRLQLAAGKLYGLIGPNGSGKSTLFKSILGLVDTDQGHITLGGRPIAELQPFIAYVPQKEEIDWQFPATVLDVVLMGRYPHKKTFEKINAYDRQLALEKLRELDILALRDKQISELSGGQQQRVFIARALAQEAELYFLDEPFVGVDITTEEKIMEILRKLVASGKTVIIIHHDLSKATHYFTDLILINRRLIAFGPAQEVMTDDNILRTFSGPQALYETAAALNRP